MPSGVSNGVAPYLGPIARASGGLVQVIEVERLLPAAVRDMLFAETQVT
jgi:chemotaxis-related protein WspB